MNNEKIIEQINKLIDRTKENKISWKAVGTNLLRWVKNEEGRMFTVTLQVQQLPVRIGIPGTPIVNNLTSNYFFTIQGTNPNEVILQVNSNLNQEFKEPLESLFTEAMKLSRDSSAEVIDKLLKDL